MRNYILLACVLFINAGYTQTISKKELIGKWSLVAVESPDYYLGIENDSVSVSKDFADKMGKPLEEIKSVFRSKMKTELSDDYILLNADSTVINRLFNDKTNVTVYWEIIIKEDKQYLKIGKNLTLINYSNELLYLTDEEYNAIFTFKKVKN